METLKYRIETCIEQAGRINIEYPSIKRISFEIEGCSYTDMLDVSKEYDPVNGIRLTDRATCTIAIQLKDAWAIIHLSSKPLIVSQTVQEVEE